MRLSQTEIQEKLRKKAFSLGFELFGIAAIDDVPELRQYEQWLDAGYAGSMDYMRRNKELRQDPGRLVEQARSVIVCGKLYHTRAPLSTAPTHPSHGWISRYAWGDDYHDILKQNIRMLYEYLVDLTQGEVRGRYYVDTGPVLEKVWAKYAGLGWIGKNTCLINQHIGSFFFTAVIVSNLAWTRGNMPAPDRCGTCTRCIEACPTGALVAPYVLDARRCISYLTIELRESVPVALREKMGRHLFGCDICQDVCPWNRKAPVSLEPAFQPRPGSVNPSIAHLLRLDEESFRQRFRRSPVKRARYTGMIRNALIAAGNSGDTRLKPLVQRFIHYETEMVQEHAEWAYDRLTKTQKTKEEAYANT